MDSTTSSKIGIHTESFLKITLFIVFGALLGHYVDIILKNMKNENNFEGLPRTPDGALYDIPPNTLCADGCNEIVGRESFVRVGADQFYIPGHELNTGSESSKHSKSGFIQ